MKTPCVYIIASSKNGGIYIGVTSDLPGRLQQHQIDEGSKHASKYQIRRIVWFETYEDMPTAIQREKSLKRWYRAWKIQLIEKTNPEWLPFTLKQGSF